MNAGFIIDKPYNWSSFQTVKWLRKYLQIRKAGHSGTLDPLATGLLVIATGKATRLLSFISEMEKEYHFTVYLGKATTTGDIEGEIITEVPIKEINREQIDSILSNFNGEIEQIPPMFSALKHKGQRLYKLAREGKEVIRKPRTITIHNIELKKQHFPKLDFKVVCSKGTYIRTLAEDLAKALGTVGHLTYLRRTRIGNFTIEKALTPEQISKSEYYIRDYGLSLEQLLPPLTKITIKAKAQKPIANGQSIRKEWLEENIIINFKADELISIFRPDGSLIALGKAIIDYPIALKDDSQIIIRINNVFAEEIDFL